MATAGELIREVRLKAGLTQSELARRAGTSQAAVARYESGDVSAVVTTLERLLAPRGYRLDLQADSEAPLVDFDTSKGLWPMLKLADELEQLLGRPVDVAPVELLRDEVAERALAEAIPL